MTGTSKPQRGHLTLLHSECRGQLSHPALASEGSNSNPQKPHVAILVLLTLLSVGFTVYHLQQWYCGQNHVDKPSGTKGKGDDKQGDCHCGSPAALLPHHHELCNTRYKQCERGGRHNQLDW